MEVVPSCDRPADRPLCAAVYPERSPKSRSPIGVFLTLFYKMSAFSLIKRRPARSYYEWKWPICLHFFVNMTSHQRRKQNLRLTFFTKCPHFLADPQFAIYNFLYNKLRGGRLGANTNGNGRSGFTFLSTWRRIKGVQNVRIFLLIPNPLSIICYIIN